MTNTIHEVASTPQKEGGPQPPSQITAFAITARIQMMTGNELARALGFEGVTGSFRSFCQEAGIKTLPGRRDCYDPVAVRHRLNLVQGLTSVDADDNTGLLEMSKVRRNV